ncbi:MAG: coproporphyrinogen III oxidase family protein [Chloroflexi bacterium]|nr:coproporphyrinogen III oxidase family protein [Chloroflexota bacterium]
MAGSAEPAPIEDSPRPPAALYLHVPFCRSICPYCDFAVVAGRATTGPSSRIAAFVDALLAELGLRASALDARWGRPPLRPPLRSAYLGGGTPSLLPAEAVARILEVVQERFGLQPGAEVTIEVNPGPDARGDLAGFRQAGANRLSIGAQSLDGSELRRLGRRHEPGDVSETLTLGRAGGFESISLDLLYDTPGQSLDGWLRTVDAALALEPDHLSLYALTLDDPDAEGLTGPLGDHLPLRPGARRWREHARRGQDEDRAAALYEAADRRLAAAGFAWYEISNWSRPGHESRHNLAYWHHEPYEAVGPGAHAFDGRTRRWNAARLDAYLGALLPSGAAEPSLPPGGHELLDARTQALESIILALRTSDGLLHSVASRPPFEGPIRWALNHGLLELEPPRLRLTTRGRLLSNELFARLAA